MKFLECTDTSGKLIIINFNFVIAVKEQNKGSRIYVGDDLWIDVQESYQDIFNLIQRSF